MKANTVRRYAMALAEVTEEPHHDFSSFRVRGKIFLTLPPDEKHLHAFVTEAQREQALATYPAFAEKLLWGGKVVGLRLTLEAASADAVKVIVRQAWENKAPKALVQPRA